MTATENIQPQINADKMNREDTPTGDALEQPSLLGLTFS